MIHFCICFSLYHFKNVTWRNPYLKYVRDTVICLSFKFVEVNIYVKRPKLVMYVLFMYLIKC